MHNAVYSACITYSQHPTYPLRKNMKSITHILYELLMKVFNNKLHGKYTLVFALKSLLPVVHRTNSSNSIYI